MVDDDDQSWIFLNIGKTDTEAETPILWPLDAKNCLIGKDPDAGKDWRQEEKGTAEDEMVGWHHRLHGHEFEPGPGVGDGQGGLACCSPWGHKESDMTEELNWTELMLELQQRPTVCKDSKVAMMYHITPSPQQIPTLTIDKELSEHQQNRRSPDFWSEAWLMLPGHERRRWTGSILSSLLGSSYMGTSQHKNKAPQLKARHWL